MLPTESDMENLAALLERAGIVVGVNPGGTPDVQSLAQGIGRLGMMLRNVEGHNRTLERRLHHEEWKVKTARSEKNLLTQQRDDLQVNYSKSLKLISMQAEAIAKMSNRLKRMERQRRKKAKAK
jgi:uncharacterized protein (DUF3084 family)